MRMLHMAAMRSALALPEMRTVMGLTRPQTKRMFKLRKLQDVPPHLQFNQDIWKGYRPLLSTAGCLRSALTLHNETFNIYSHWLTFFFFLFSARDYATIWPATDNPRYYLIVSFICVDLASCTLPFLLSIIYHTFMCHSSGEPTYTRLLKLDILGVWFACTFGPIATIYTGLYCHSNVRHLYLLWYFLLSLTMLYYLLVVDCKRRRVLVLTIQFAFRVLIHVVRLSPYAATDPEAVKFLIAMDVISAVGALVNALHIPERWAPGKLDYAFNGHSVMHVAAFLCVAVGRQGFLLDMAWLGKGDTC